MNRLKVLLIVCKFFFGKKDYYSIKFAITRLKNSPSYKVDLKSPYHHSKLFGIYSVKNQNAAYF